MLLLVLLQILVLHLNLHLILDFVFALSDVLFCPRQRLLNLNSTFSSFDYHLIVVIDLVM